MSAFLNLLTVILVPPMALLYLYLLNTDWRIGTPAKAALIFVTGASVPFFQWLFPDTVFRSLLCWTIFILLVFFFSRVHDARFFFILFSATLFTYLTAAFSRVVAYYLPIHRFWICLMLDVLLLILCARFFRPAFLSGFHTIRRGWVLLLPFPTLIGLCFILLLSLPGFDLPSTQVFIVVLSGASIAVYLVFFQFFRLLFRRQESTISTAVLESQYQILAAHAMQRDRREERARIVRHDLRHYLHMLRNRLTMGDREGAHEALAAVQRAVAEVLAAAGEDAHHD